MLQPLRIPQSWTANPAVARDWRLKIFARMRAPTQGREICFALVVRSIQVVVAVMLWLPGVATADDEPPPRLSGRVTDRVNGGPVEGAEVFVANAAGHQRMVVTDRDGQYAIEVEPGLYYVVFSLGDFRTVGRVTVERGRPARLDGRVDSTPVEVIVIRDMVPPKVPPKPVSFSERKAPPYSDAAILQDAWTRAWMVIDISPTGEVMRLKFLKRPGYDLDAIAISEAFRLRFEPARDDSGAAIETWLVWGIEWPANTYLIARGLPRTTMPPMVGLPAHPSSGGVPCRGSGPWRMSSKLWVGYRDCSMPDLSRMSSERWIARPPE